VILGKWQTGQFKKPRPANSIDPFNHAFPILCILLVGLQDFLDNGCCFRPARRIVGNATRNQLLKTWLAACIGMVAANPDCKLGMLGIVDLHRWTRGIAGPAADAFFLIDLQTRLSVDHGRANCRNRTTGNHGWTLAYIGNQRMVNLGWPSMMAIDGDVTLSSAIDLTAGGGDVHPIWHPAMLELVNQLIHHRLDDTRCIGTGNIAMQPSLGM